MPISCRTPQDAPIVGLVLYAPVGGSGDRDDMNLIERMLGATGAAVVAILVGVSSTIEPFPHAVGL